MPFYTVLITLALAHAGEFARDHHTRLLLVLHRVAACVTQGCRLRAIKLVKSAILLLQLPCLSLKLARRRRRLRFNDAIVGLWAMVPAAACSSCTARACSCACGKKRQRLRIIAQHQRISSRAGVKGRGVAVAADEAAAIRWCTRAAAAGQV